VTPALDIPAMTVTAVPADVPAAPPRVLLADPAAEHQVVIRYTTGKDRGVMVSCNCLRYARWGRPGHVPIEARPGAFPADELRAAWARWHAGRGIRVRP
jgi:hypothetical protein